jgi:hypothetical protein
MKKETLLLLLTVVAAGFIYWTQNSGSTEEPKKKLLNEAVSVEAAHQFDSCVLFSGMRYPPDAWGVFLPFRQDTDEGSFLANVMNLPRRNASEDALVYTNLLTSQFFSGMNGFVDQWSDQIVIRCFDGKFRYRLEYAIKDGSAEFALRFPGAQVFAGSNWVADYRVKEGKTTGTLELRYFLNDRPIAPSKRFKSVNDPPDIPTLPPKGKRK